jgi:hypothetical protein
MGVAFLVMGFLALRTIVRPWIYDVMIVRMTETWYREFLNRVPRGARVLVSSSRKKKGKNCDKKRKGIFILYFQDVGIGTGAALIANSDILVRRKETLLLSAFY